VKIGEYIMKKKVILQIVMPLFVSTLLISCDDQSVPSLTTQKVVLASGVNFKTDKFVVINPINGKEVQPCGKTVITEKSNPTTQKPYQSNTELQNNQPCDNQIIEPSEALLNALRINNPIEGVILKDGKPVKARFLVSVQALYEGSYCYTFYLNGVAYTHCVNGGAFD
jgi:hypothetical protein